MKTNLVLLTISIAILPLKSFAAINPWRHSTRAAISLSSDPSLACNRKHRDRQWSTDTDHVGQWCPQALQSAADTPPLQYTKGEEEQERYSMRMEWRKERRHWASWKNVGIPLNMHTQYLSFYSLLLLFLTLSAGSSLDHLQHHCWAAPPDPGRCGCWINTTRHWHPGQGKEGPYYPQRSDLTHCRTSFNTLNLLIKLSVSRYHCLGCMHSVCMLDYLVSSPC